MGSQPRGREDPEPGASVVDLVVQQQLPLRGVAAVGRNPPVGELPHGFGVGAGQDLHRRRVPGRVQRRLQGALLRRPVELPGAEAQQQRQQQEHRQARQQPGAQAQGRAAGP
jgi:hypothetical protein